MLQIAIFVCYKNFFVLKLIRMLKGEYINSTVKVGNKNFFLTDTFLGFDWRQIMSSKKTRLIAVAGIMGALTFVAMFLETYVFSVLIPLAPPCFISISLAITLSLVDDWRYMFVGGTALGVCSFIMSFIIGNAVFMLPWISILPRVFIGIVAFGVCKFIQFLTSKSTNKFVKDYLPYGLGAFFGVITNTVLTLSMMAICSFVGIEMILKTFMTINFPVELIASTIIVPILARAVKRNNKAV